MAAQWHYVQNGQALGPIPEEQLKALLRAGTLGPDDQVWREGMGGWQAARQVPDLTQAPEPPKPPAPKFVPIPLAAPPEFSADPYATPRADLGGAFLGDAAAGVAPGIVEVLRQTKPWARFLAVLGFIGTGFMLLGALGMVVMGSTLNRGLPVGLGVGMAMAYVFLAGVQLPAVLFLNRYASRIGRLVGSHSSADLQDALTAQRSFWRYLGILTLILMCLYLVVIILLVIGMSVAGFRGLR